MLLVFGNFHLGLTEGDILTIFSQYGTPIFIKLIRDKETGKSKGFGFLKYADQRSTVLAVDNLNGTTILGRTIRVDHTRYTLKEDEEAEEEYEQICQTVLKLGREDLFLRKRQQRMIADTNKSQQSNKLIKDGVESTDQKEIVKTLDDLEKEEADPMAAYLRKK